MLIDEHINKILSIYLSRSRIEEYSEEVKQYISKESYSVTDVAVLIRTLNLTINDLLGPYSLSEYECGYVPLSVMPNSTDAIIRLTLIYLEKNVSFDFAYLYQTFGIDKEKYTELVQGTAPLSITDAFMLAYIHKVSLADLFGPTVSKVTLKKRICGRYNMQFVEKQTQRDINDGLSPEMNARCKNFYTEFISTSRGKIITFDNCVGAGMYEGIKIRVIPYYLSRFYSDNIFFILWFCLISKTSLYTIMGIDLKQDEFDIKEYSMFEEIPRPNFFREINDNRYLLSKNLAFRLVDLTKDMTISKFKSEYNVDVDEKEEEAFDINLKAIMSFCRRSKYATVSTSKNKYVSLPTIDAVTQMCATLGISIYTLLGFRAPDAVNVRPKLEEKYKNLFKN